MTGLGFNEELPFEIKMAESQYSNTEGIETEIQLADSGYGQGQVLVNPLHMACIYSAFCNEGNVIKTDVSYASSYDAIKKVIADGKKFDGIFCYNDMMALGALQALKDSGISVPEKCKVVGFDDITLSEICDPPITTIQQDTDMFGKKSVETLLNLIENNETKNKNDIYVIPVKLVKRTTA